MSLLLAVALLWWGLPSVVSAAEVQRLGPPPPAKVKRVVTLAPSLTELVLALHRADVLVGVSRFDERPEVKSLPRVGGFVDPSVEAVLRLKPELLLVQPAPGNRAPVEKLAELGVPVLALPLTSVADTLVAMREVGKALGASEDAERLVHELEAARARVHERVRALKAPRVLFIYGFAPLVVAGPGSFADELLRDAGGANVVPRSSSAYPVYSVEAALAARPDVIVDASDNASGRETLRGAPGLREARWVRPGNEALLHPGPQLAAGLEDLAKLLHPSGGDGDDAGHVRGEAAGGPSQR